MGDAESVTRQTWSRCSVGASASINVNLFTSNTTTRRSHRHLDLRRDAGRRGSDRRPSRSSPEAARRIASACGGLSVSCSARPARIRLGPSPAPCLAEISAKEREGSARAPAARPPEHRTRSAEQRPPHEVRARDQQHDQRRPPERAAGRSGPAAGRRPPCPASAAGTSASRERQPSRRSARPSRRCASTQHHRAQAVDHALHRASARAFGVPIASRYSTVGGPQIPDMPPRSPARGPRPRFDATPPARPADRGCQPSSCDRSDSAITGTPEHEVERIAPEAPDQLRRAETASRPRRSG